MKKQLFYFLIFTSVMIGCKKENLTYPITTKSALWETQLDSAMLLGNKSLAKYGIQMINYNLLGVIQNNADVINVKQRLLSNGSYCPYYSNNGTISIKPVETIKQLKTNGAFYNFVSAKICLDTIIKVGQRKVNIQWEYNGQKLNSLCVVSEEGIVYDDIITNLFILNDKSNTILQIPVGLNTKLNTLAIDYGPFISKTLTFSQAFDAYWLWGSQRGHAEVNLIVTGNGSRYYVSDTPCYIWSIVSSFTTATSYMSLGTCDAIIRQTVFTPGDRGQVSAIYALYLASPLVSIQITDQWSYFSLSFGSSNVGSELHASGAFNVTPGDFM